MDHNTNPGNRLFVLSKKINSQVIHWVINKSGSSGNVVYNDFACVNGQWNTYALVVQESSSGSVTYTATVDGNIRMQGSYTLTGELTNGEDLEVYASNPLHNAAPHQVRNFYYQTL